MLEGAVLAVGLLATALIAIAVLAKDSRSTTNKLFVLLTAALIGWSLTTYASLHTGSDEETLRWIRWIMFFVVIQNTAFFLLVRTFPSKRLSIFHDKRNVMLVGYSFLTALVSLSPLLFTGFEDGAPIPGVGMALFLPHAIVSAIGGVSILVARYRQATGLVKLQLRYFLAGTLLLFSLLPIGNFLIPLLFKSNLGVTFSPLYMLLFAGSIAYAIVKHKFFDIRLFVARSVAYVITILVLAAIYTTVIFAITRLFIHENDVGFRTQAVYTATALLLALSFAWFKAQFDKLSKRLFFRDSYEPQKFLNELNELLVESVELSSILKGTSELLTSTLKSSTSTFIIHQTAYYPLRVIGSKLPVDELEYAELNAFSKRIDDKVVVVDLLEETDKDFKDLLDKFDVAVAVRLTPKLHTSKGNIGFLLLGHKLNGASYGKQDVDVLEILANELVVAIENGLRFEEIQMFNATLQDKIEQATEQLKKSNNKLKALDESKDDFISMASHQLRTPLTSIKGYLSMVLDGDVGEVVLPQRKVLEEAYASSQRMVYLIGDFLNVSRLQTGKFVLERAPVNLPQILESEIDQLRATAEPRSIKLIYDAPHDFPILEIDENKIRQVMMNFIDNAIYYAKPGGGTIRIELAKRADHIFFKVVDDGIGVPRSEQHQLFSKFYRATNARKARPDGTGIGLFMAKKVVVAHGGAILFESIEGKGSTFGFRLPLEAASPQPVEPAQ